MKDLSIEDFPKNESTWEELFEFGKDRLREIAELKAKLAAKDAVIATIKLRLIDCEKKE